MNIQSYVFLVVKLIFSLLNFLIAYLLGKVFVNKFFSTVNGSATVLALILVIIILIVPAFNKPKIPEYFSFSGDVKTINLTQQQAKDFLLNEDYLDEYVLISQKQYLNLSNLAIISEDKQKADHFLKMARYINPNIDFIK
jgi:hypothetical protein